MGNIAEQVTRNPRFYCKFFLFLSLLPNSSENLTFLVVSSTIALCRCVTVFQLFLWMK